MRTDQASDGWTNTTMTSPPARPHRFGSPRHCRQRSYVDRRQWHSSLEQDHIPDHHTGCTWATSGTPWRRPWSLHAGEWHQSCIANSSAYNGSAAYICYSTIGSAEGPWSESFSLSYPVEACSLQTGDDRSDNEEEDHPDDVSQTIISIPDNHNCFPLFDLWFSCRLHHGYRMDGDFLTDFFIFHLRAAFPHASYRLNDNFYNA